MTSSSVRKEPTSISCDDEDCEMLSNASFVNNSNVDESHETIEPHTKRAKTLTSYVWNCFVKIGIGKDGKERCKCNAYGTEHTCASKLGTSLTDPFPSDRKSAGNSTVTSKPSSLD